MAEDLSSSSGESEGYEPESYDSDEYVEDFCFQWEEEPDDCMCSARRIIENLQ